MADMEFDLGEAVGGYEQAKADRDFYLNMIDMGRTNKGAFMASPIAAYLYGVSNVKMANMRAKAQNIEDQRQAEKDAIAAQEKAQQRATNIDNQIVSLVKGARDGSIPASVAATMLGPLLKEKGINLKQFDADRSVLIGNEPGDTEDFEWDLSEKENSLESGRNKRAEDRISWEREKQERGIEAAKERQERGLEAAAARQRNRVEGQKEIAKYREDIKQGAGGTAKGASFSNKWQTFKTGYQPLLDIVNGKDTFTDIDEVPDDVIDGFLRDYIPEFGIEGIYEIVKKEKERRANGGSNKVEDKIKKQSMLSRLFGGK